MEIIYRGAEAILYTIEQDGEKILVKERIKKGYRIKQIDEILRKERTRHEARLLRSARECGVLTPKILEVDEKECKIKMEFVEGERIKELLNSADKGSIEKVCYLIGKNVGKLHSHKIIHGDLTTSNMILKDEKIYFLDFGLGFFSNRVEDFGTDLNLLYEALRSTHFKILELCWKNIVKGYKEEFEKADQALKKMEEIEKRARYAKR
jgi:Kae1-associated kinase Bud32